MKYFYVERIQGEYSKRAYLVLVLILALALLVRIFGVWNIGLHGDEETSAMPALEILRSGIPAFPSGLVYGRAIPHSYLLALSVWIFGKNEWALRLPSCIAGVFAVLFSFFLGKHFLRPRWNIFFTAVIALQPWIIAYSKTARMYIFFLSGAILFLERVLSWERNGTWGKWITALLSFLLTLSFHQLAIFLSFCYFIPFLLEQKKKSFLQGLMGFSFSMCAFLALRHFTQSLYGPPSTVRIAKKTTAFYPLSYLWNEYSLWLLLLGAILVSITSLALYLYWEKGSNISLTGLSLVTSSWISALLLQYHLACIFLAVGAIVLLRRELKFRTLAVLAIPLFLIALFQVLALTHFGHVMGPIKIAKALVGKVSLYPYINFFGKFPLGSLAYVLVLLIGARHLTKRERLPEHYLIFLVAVWLPLFTMGYFVWYFADRYAFQLVPFYILCCLSGLLYIASHIDRGQDSQSTWPKYAIVLLTAFSFINPMELYNSVNPTYKNYPDHKGAAEFMSKIKLGPDDVVLAEDVLQQVYYGTRVDYWLRGLNDARQFVRSRNGKLRDVYTNTPLIGTGKEFEKLINSARYRRIYVVGNGETADYQQYYLSNGLKRVYNKYLKKAHILYRGRDGKTLIWSYDVIH